MPTLLELLAAELGFLARLQTLLALAAALRGTPAFSVVPSADQKKLLSLPD